MKNVLSRKTVVSRRTAVVTIIACSITLGGCLKDEVTTVGSSVTEPIENNAPTISGTPQAGVTLGDQYSFIPTASDADGDVLTFSIQNAPSWASFNTSTGELSGQPSLADIGVFSQIVISVSDGTDTASIPEYTVTVSQIQLGSMSLSWTPPTENTDGTALSDLAGYRIYYGLSRGSYPNQVVIDTPGIASYVIENLTPNTYYVVATSINVSGVESEFSNVAIKTVN